MRFKIGDVVRTKHPLDRKIGIVEDIDTGWNYPIKVRFNNGTFLWYKESELELVKAADLLKSKIGDC